MKTRHDSYITGIVDDIVDSYHADPRTRHIDAGDFANQTAVIEVIHMLRELLFPGFFGKQDIASGTLKFHAGTLVIAIRDKLEEQVRNVIIHRAQDQSAIDRSPEDASRLVREFLATIPRLRATLGTDVQAAFDGDPACQHTDEIIVSYPGFFAITIYRLAHEFYLLQVPLIPRIMSEYAHAVTGIDIHAGATIDESFFIDHGTGVVIGETTTIGKRVKIYQGTTLGALSTRGGQKLKGLKRHPTIEDDVTVYSGASILGGETIIGKGVVISSNVFVTQSVPPRTRVTVKNPELQYRDHKPTEFHQTLPLDWTI